jgi:hypothetical protein
MTEKQQIKSKDEIANFKDTFLKKYGINLYVHVEHKCDFKISMELLSKSALNALHYHQPEFINIKSISHRLRQRDFLVYLQAVSYLAWKEGHSKTSIGKHVKRTHATVINSIREVENRYFNNDKMMIKAVNNIELEIQNYVGIIPKNTKIKPITEPSIDTIWDEARRFLK